MTAAVATIAVMGTLIATRARAVTYREFTTTSGAPVQLTLPDGS